VAVNLKQASLKLTTTAKAGKGVGGVVLFQAELESVRLEHESRPRTESQLVGLSLGAIYLRDKVTPASLFPLLIAPQTAEEAPLHPKTSRSNSKFFLTLET
jgi:hypothetical protein